MSWTRRAWMSGVGAGGVLALVPGCVDWSRRLGGRERHLLYQGPRPLPVVQWQRMHPDATSVLRQRTLPARHLPAPARQQLDRLMRETLTRSGGVGLAAPQVGFCRRVCLVQLQRPGKPVITCVDPVITGRTTEPVDGYEACLSVQGVGGLVRRSRGVEVAFHDVAGRPQRLRSSGWEARIFQHELDHLGGVLYLDRLRGPLLPIDEVRRRRRRRHAVEPDRHPWLAARAPGEGPWVL